MAEIWGTLLAYLSPSQTILFHTTALLVEDPLRRGVDTHVLLRNVYDWGVRNFLANLCFFFLFLRSSLSHAF